MTASGSEEHLAFAADKSVTCGAAAEQPADAHLIAEPAGPAPAIAPPEIGDPGSQASVPARLLSPPTGRADTIIDAGVIGTLDVRAASVRGRSHRFALGSDVARTRQDEYCLQATTNADWLVAFVADGVSQAKQSHVAATIAARRGCQLVTDLLDGGTEPAAMPWGDEIVPRLAGYIVSEARRNIANLDATDGAGLDAGAREAAELMATTAIAAVVATTPLAQGETQFVVAVLAGDSSAWILSQGQWRPLTGVKNEGSDIASMEVRPLPLISSPLVVDGLLAPGEALFLLSDGIGDPLGDGRGQVGMYLAHEWTAPPNAHHFGAQVDFLRRSFDDDRTAVGMWTARGPGDEDG